MQRLFQNVIAARMKSATALAGLLLLAGCAASMNSSSSLSTPVLTPAGGTYNSSQSVTVSDAMPGAVLYCTTDGSTPSKSSPVCPEPVTIYKSETLSAIAVAPDGTASSPVSASYVITLPAAVAPVISPSGGTFTAVQAVTLSDITTGATIYYTTDGTTPSTASAVYGGPITVSANETINAVAISAATTLSPVATASFVINFPAATPIISPAGGTFTSIQTATISDATAGATIYYTLDGSTPTVSSAVYNGSITISKSETIQAVALAPGSSISVVASATFTLNLTAATPVISPAGGTYTSIQTATITDATSSSTIYYTLDGSAPTVASTPYSGPITVSKSETINAIAVATGYANSAVATAAYILNLPPAPLPVFSPAAGTYTSIQNVTISDSASGATIYYTTDGSTPTTSSPQYATPINVAATQTIKAIATATDSSTSAIASATYTINLPAAATPAISPNGGTFTSTQTVTITDSTPAATIYYTLNGSTPTTSSAQYTAPISVDASETVKAIAIASGYSVSPIASAAFTFTQPAAATPVISPAGGTFNSAQTVTIMDSTPNSAIYYTTDGTTPSTSSTKYTGTITVSASETINAVASATGFNLSAVASESFTINQTVATPIISPTGGTFTASQMVTLSDTTTGAAIFYTTDGSTPSASSTQYSAPITVSATETVKAIATFTGYTQSAIASASFTINTVTGVPLSGVVTTGTAPIVGASVQMYAAGTTGYGSVPTALLATAVTTDNTGTFSLGYVCPAAPGDQVYLVATGGSVGGTANPDAALMLALGTCANLTSGETVTINEVTTISSAYALAAFATNASGGGIDIGAPAPGAACVSTGANTCNYVGMENAFKTVANLVDAKSGTALSITPFYASTPVASLNTSTVPQARINTLAGVLQSCVAPTAAGNCVALFSAATPTGGTAPVDTLQTALAIAQNPGNNVATFYGLIATTPPYTPNLSAAPNDFALAITYTGGGLGLPYSFTSGSMANTSMDIDPAGNIYVTAYESKHISSNGILAIFNSSGEASTPATSSTANIGGFLLSDPPNSYDGPLSIAIDQSKNIWIDNFGDLRELSPNLIFTTVIGPSSNPLHVTGNITIDLSGNVWAANGTDIVEVSNSGTLLSPTGSGWNGVSSADSAGFSDVQHLTFDSTGNTLWAADNNGSNSLYQIDPSNGKILVNYFPPNGNPVGVTTPLVADGSGNIYGCPVSSTPTLDTFNAASTSVIASNTIGNSRGCGTGPMVIDGAGHIFAANFNSTGTAAILDEFSTTGAALSPAEGFSASSAEESVVLNKAATQKAMSVDGSGNVWVLNGNTGNASVVGNALVQMIGLAAPVVTPNSVALTNGELATRP